MFLQLLIVSSRSQLLVELLRFEFSETIKQGDAFLQGLLHCLCRHRQVFLAILSRFVLLCGLTLYLLMVFRICFHSIEQILSHILVGMKIVCQHSCKQRKVLLNISWKLGCLPIIGNIDRMHQLLVYFALHDFTSKFQHGNHITEMLQHLQLQFARANYLASDFL